MYGPIVLIAFLFTNSEGILLLWMPFFCKSGIYLRQNVRVHLWYHSRRHLPAFLYSI